MRKRERFIIEQIKEEDNPNFKGYKGVTMIRYGYMGRKVITANEIEEYRKKMNKE